MNPSFTILMRGVRGYKSRTCYLDEKAFYDRLPVFGVVDKVKHRSACAIREIDQKPFAVIHKECMSHSVNASNN